MDSYVTGDTLAHPVAMETGDGWLVISTALRIGSVVPPYQYQYSHDHFRDIGDAEARIYELENDDWQGWSFVALVACKAGVPLGCKKVLP